MIKNILECFQMFRNVDYCQILEFYELHKLLLDCFAILYSVPDFFL